MHIFLLHQEGTPMLPSTRTFFIVLNTFAGLCGAACNACAHQKNASSEPPVLYGIHRRATMKRARVPQKIEWLFPDVCEALVQQKRRRVVLSTKPPSRESAHLRRLIKKRTRPTHTNEDDGYEADGEDNSPELPVMPCTYTHWCATYAATAWAALQNYAHGWWAWF